MKNHRVAIAAALLLSLAAVISTGAMARAGQDAEYYMMQGTLQVLDRGYKTAVIDGLSWPLIDDFSGANIISDLHEFGPTRTDLRTRPLLVRYYLIIQPVPTPIASTDLLRKKLPTISTEVTAEKLKELNEKGAKVFKIYVPPM